MARLGPVDRFVEGSAELAAHSTSGVAHAKTAAGLRKAALEPLRPHRACPACGREIRICSCH